MLRLCMVWAALLCVAGPAAADSNISFVMTDPNATGLDYDQSGSVCAGASVGDFDGDGWLDVCLTGGRPAGIQIYRNNGDGTFSNVSGAVLPPGLPPASMALFADLDNDGDEDLVYAREFDTYRDVSFGCLQNENGLFTIVPVSDNLARESHDLGGLVLGDYDGDGDLDVFKTHYNGHFFVLRNEGANGFADVSTQVGDGLYARRAHWSLAYADFNNDRLGDLHLTVDFGTDKQFRNQGDGTFVDVSAEANMTRVGTDMGLAVGDIDNDGDLDIFATNIGVHALYVNDGAGVFNDEAQARGVQRSNPLYGVAWGAAFGDFDNDGDLDLAMTDAMVAGAVFENDGAGYFQNVSANVDSDLKGRGMVAFDFDNDGDLDLLNTSSAGPPDLLENTLAPSASRHWLEVRLRGTFSNRDGVGARLQITTGDQTQIREVQCGTSFVSGGPLYQHIGLGGADTVDTLRVLWPSGATQTLGNTAADRVVTVFEVDPDFNGDNVYDLDDLTTLLIHYGQSNATHGQGDANGDGVINLSDLAILLSVITV